MQQRQKMEPRLKGGEPPSSILQKKNTLPKRVEAIIYSIWEQLIAMEIVASILGQTWEAIKDRHQHLQQT